MPGEISRQYEGPPDPPGMGTCPGCDGTGYALIGGQVCDECEGSGCVPDAPPEQ